MKYYIYYTHIYKRIFEYLLVQSALQSLKISCLTNKLLILLSFLRLKVILRQFQHAYSVLSSLSSASYHGCNRNRAKQIATGRRTHAQYLAFRHFSFFLSPVANSNPNALCVRFISVCESAKLVAKMCCCCCYCCCNCCYCSSRSCCFCCSCCWKFDRLVVECRLSPCLSQCA